MLAGVLIFITFFALVGGAMLMRLSAESAQFRVAAARAQNQATLQSAAEARIASLKSSASTCALSSTTSTFTLNGQTATVICTGAPPPVSSIALSPIGHCQDNGPCAAQASGYGTPSNYPAFTIDGSYISTDAAYYGAYSTGQLGTGNGEYLTVDDQANVYWYKFNNSGDSGGSKCPGTDGGAPGLTISSAFFCPRYVVSNPGATPTAAPLLYLDTQRATAGVIDALVPLNGATGCLTPCVELIESTTSASPQIACKFSPLTGTVKSQPQLGANLTTTAFFGDSAGFVYAFNASTAGHCTSLLTAPQSLMAGIPPTGIAAGPFVLPGSSAGSDDLIFVTTNGYVEHFSFNGAAMSPVGAPVSLGVTGSVTGATLVGSQCPLLPCHALSAAAPTQLVVTFANGYVASASVYSTRTATGPAVAPNVSGGAITRGPRWCPASSCGSDLVGVDYSSNGSTGELFVLNASDLSTRSYYVAPGNGIGFNTTPLPIAVPSSTFGHWLVGADSGYLYEVAQPSGCASPCAMGQYTAYGVTQGGRALRSSPQGTASGTDCGGYPCLFVGARDGYQYYLSLAMEYGAGPSDIYVCLASVPNCSPSDSQLWVRILNSTYQVVLWTYQNL